RHRQLRHSGARERDQGQDPHRARRPHRQGAPHRQRDRLISAMAPRSVQLRCPAKLNLFLEVLRRRPDGYHELSTVMVPISLFDTLTVREAKKFSLEVDGPPLPGTNTVEKAYRAVAKRRKIPGVRATLAKGIPAGSGMGGGSSDAAAMIEALDRLFDLGLDRHEVAAEIGSDVNFFLERGPALCTGRGE